MHCNENPIYAFPEKELGGLSPNKADRGNIKIAHRHMNVEIGTEAVSQLLFWEYKNGIFVVVHPLIFGIVSLQCDIGSSVRQDCRYCMRAGDIGPFERLDC